MLTDEQVEQLKALRAKYPGNRMEKFAENPREYEAIAIEVARGLDLDQPPRRRILDIGCGLGFFSHACERWGHAVTGLDLPDPMIARALQILRIKYYKHVITASESIRAGCAYNLITMFGVNLHDGTDYWDAPKYTFLAADIRSRLQPDGSWVIRPNAPVGQNSPTANLMKPEWWQQVAGLDAEITTTINHSFQVTVKW